MAKRLCQQLGSSLLDTLYPPHCECCETPLTGGAALCEDCKASLPRLTAPFCERCGEAFQGQIDGPFQCPNCGPRSYVFQFARPAMLRDEATLDLIHRLKYGRQIHLAKALGELACEAFHDPRLSQALAEQWALVPIPLHPSRLRKRHFNQAAELARVIHDHTGLPVVDALSRIKKTTTQTQLTRRLRLANLKDAFSLSRTGKSWVKETPLGAILIDDVLTTGATANACAKTLRKAGVTQIVVVTVMRG